MLIAMERCDGVQTRAAELLSRDLRKWMEPEDILQTVYLEVFRQLGRFEDRGEDSFLNWVLTILDSKIIDAHRALHRQKRDVAREVHLPSGVTGADGIVRFVSPGRDLVHLITDRSADNNTPRWTKFSKFRTLPDQQ